MLLSAQTSARKQFSTLSRPEKCWVLLHPFVAKRAYDCTKYVVAAVDSLKRAGTIGTDHNGGSLDAFRHAYWMANLSSAIGSRKALKLGKAHEKGNYLEYKRHRLEDSILPDSVSCAMDLANNRVGAHSVDKCYSPPGLQQHIIDMLNKGELFVIKKDAQGNYLDCNGKRIDMEAWAGKWSIPKCLVASGAP